MTIRNLIRYLAAATLIVSALLFSPQAYAQGSPLDFWLTNHSAKAYRSDPAHSGRQDIVLMKILVDKKADKFGLPREVVHTHIRLESAYRSYARNPASTAKGLSQIIRCTHAAIILRDCSGFSEREHFSRASDPDHNLNVGLSHIAAAYAERPHWSAKQLWRNCHVTGLANCGSSLQKAAMIYAKVVAR